MNENNINNLDTKLYKATYLPYGQNLNKILSLNRKMNLLPNVDVMHTYHLAFIASNPYTFNGRLTFLLGTLGLGVTICDIPDQNIVLTSGSTVTPFAQVF